MSKKTYRVKLQFEGDKPRVYRTDGQPTHCCSFQRDYFCWEKNTKFNEYNGWRGYISEMTLAKTIETYNPDGLTI
jgi:hypothetical protein